MVHELRCWPPFFGDVMSGIKTFEYRADDRHFTVGDTLLLREFVPSSTTPPKMKAIYTGREVSVLVTYKIDGGHFAIPEGFCILGIAHAPKKKRGGEPPAPNSASLPCEQHSAGKDCWMTDISKCGDKPCFITQQA